MVLNKSFTKFIKENTLQGAGIQRSQYSSPPSTCSEMKWCLLISNPVSLLIIITTPNSNHAAATAAKSLQSCLTLCDPIDGSPLGSSVPGILQARILEWVAISFSNA